MNLNDEAKEFWTPLVWLCAALALISLVIWRESFTDLWLWPFGLILLTFVYTLALALPYGILRTVYDVVITVARRD